MLSTFAVLLGIYMFVMLVGNMHLEFDDQRNTGLHVRTLMAVYQVLVVCAILGMQSVFLFFIGVVKRDSISFVLVSRKGDPMPHNSEHKASDIIDPPPPASGRINGFAEPESSTCGVCASDSVSQACHADSVTMSVASDDILLNIVFDNSTNLDLYVLYVNFVGLILWDSFVCFNFATYDSCFVLVCGMLLGWVCNSFSKECHCHKTRVPPVQGQKMLMLFYTFMFLLIMSLCASKWQVPVDLHTSEQLNLYVPAFLSGFFWTAVSTDVAFTDLAAGASSSISKGILYDARRALPTFLLVMCVSALYSSPLTRNDALEYIGGLSRLACVHVLLLEPVLIFVSLYVMIIAFEKHRSTDFMLAIVLVQGICLVYRSDTYDAVVIASMTSCVLLLTVHVTRLLRS